MTPADDEPEDRDADDLAPVNLNRAATILIVDDRPENLLALEAVLEPLEVTIVRARSGEEALRAADERSFAAVLLDVQMPGMDGFETAARMRQLERCRHVPIIFLTAIYGEPAYVSRGYDLGAIDYLSKPIETEVLRAKVQAVIDLFTWGERLRLQEQVLRERQVAHERELADLRYRQLADSIPHIVWATTAEGRLTYANERFRKAACETDDGLRGLVHADDQARFAALWASGLRDGREWSGELRICSGPDRAPRWHHVRATPVLEESTDRVGSWIGTASDMHDRRVAEEALHVEHAALEKASRAKDEFLAMLSHELRTPLNAISGWADLLRSSPRPIADNELAKGLETIARNAGVQARLIADLLDVTRIASGKLGLDFATTRLDAVVHAALEAVRPAGEAKGLTIDRTTIAAEVLVRGDPARLEQVMTNLLSNAIKFTPSGGVVTVALARSDERATITVTDSGEGIERDFLPHVFERFRQSRGQGSRGGLGLGLAIVQHIVDRHGGSVTATSEGPGRGACFVVDLPLESSARATPLEDASPSPARPGLSGTSVLVVDDDADSLEFVRRALERAGARVTGARSRDEALEVRADYDVVVSDIAMAGADGYSLIRAIRARERDETVRRVGAVALTASARESDREQCIAAGFDAHIPKPVTIDDLVRTVGGMGARKGEVP